MFILVTEIKTICEVKTETPAYINLNNVTQISSYLDLNGKEIRYIVFDENNMMNVKESLKELRALFPQNREEV